MFVDLRRKFNKIAYDIGAGGPFVFALCQQAVQGMAKFMEQGFYFVHSQQRRGVADRFGETAYVAYQGAGCSLLFAVIAHPCATAFSGTREIVYIEYTQLGAVSVFHFEDFYIRMIGRDTFQFA